MSHFINPFKLLNDDKQMIVKNNRVIVLAMEIDGDPRTISGARFYKKDSRWSFPIEQMPKILSLCKKNFVIEEEWFDIFPEYKILLNF